MKTVIQCAARKQPAATTFRAADGRRVAFVAQPDLAPRDAGTVPARPDDQSGGGRSWRKRLLGHNQDPGANPLVFAPAYRLHANEASVALVDSLGPGLVFILSAGWGLIPATFLTPYYDITFSASADPWKRRRRDDPYEDFCLI